MAINKKSGELQHLKPFLKVLIPTALGLLVLFTILAPGPLEEAKMASAQRESSDGSSPVLGVPVPEWVKNNTRLWSEGRLGDSQFILGVRYLIANDVMQLPHDYSNLGLVKPIPSWVKTTGGWWVEGNLSDYEFVTSLQYLISSGAISLGHVANGTAAQDSPTLENNFQKGKITIDNTTLNVQVAETPDQMVEGLQFQQPLPYNQGMIFVFGQPQVVAMWMKDMQFPLDMIWFDSDGNIVHIERNLPPCVGDAPCQVYDGGRQDAKYVLEVTAGFADKFGITDKSKLSILSIPP